jgi:16S rRNA (adenine1518-N6/adenine1519-N6)-dimethyltransferase
VVQKKPRLGQNFLVDPNACRAIVAALGDIRGDAVLEIGPGAGALTDLLARSAAHLTLVEFDAALAGRLASSYAGAAHIDVRHVDILNFDLTALARERQRRLAVVGNLPYYITSDILLHLLAHADTLDRAVLMVQREVAERVTAAPGSSDYGALSATVQLYAEVELLFTLPPQAFSPPPDVHSSVFRLRIRPRFAELGVEPREFIPFLRACFAQKRKTLANNLRAAGYRPEAIQPALQAAGLASTIRTEAVDLPAMAAIFRSLRGARAQR